MLKQSQSSSSLNQSSISKVKLTQFDFTSLEENDPVLQDGYIQIYDQEIQFRIQLSERDEQTTDFPNAETLRVRVLIQGTENNLESMKIELSSDNDLFFHFIHKADKNNFEQNIQPAQQLHCKFMDYPAVCVKNFEKCYRETTQFIPVLTIMSDGQGRVDILQLTEYKSVELFTLDFVQSDEETIRNIITFKYQNVKQKLNAIEVKLRDINDVVKVKNPSLLLQIQKQRISINKQK